jgi:Uma2 family endonuclease
MTAEEFCRWWDEQPDEDCRFELHSGQLVRFGLAGERHGFVCGNMCGLLGQHAITHGGFGCSNYSLLLVGRDPDTVLGPDLLYFTGRVGDKELNGMFWDRLPAVAVEVLNFDDTAAGMHWRVTQMLRRGLPHVWVVDPESRAVSAFTPEEGSPCLLQGSDEFPLLKVPVCRAFSTHDE